MPDAEKIKPPTIESLAAVKKWQTSKLREGQRKGHFDQDLQSNIIDTEKKIRLEQIREKAKKIDVTYDLNRWFGDRMRQNDPGLLEIQKEGFISMAAEWLKSTNPEQMKFGTATKEQRIEEAQKYAKLAEMPLEEIAKKYNLKIPE
jgi:hypothetical protein